MALEGYREYRKREFCRDAICPIQLKLNKFEPGTEEYAKVHEECRKACRFTTREFHYWLIKKGFLIVKPEEEDGSNAVGKEEQAVQDNQA